MNNKYKRRWEGLDWLINHFFLCICYELAILAGWPNCVCYYHDNYVWGAINILKFEPCQRMMYLLWFCWCLGSCVMVTVSWQLCTHACACLPSCLLVCHGVRTKRWKYTQSLHGVFVSLEHQESHEVSGRSSFITARPHVVCPCCSSLNKLFSVVLHLDVLVVDCVSKYTDG